MPVALTTSHSWLMTSNDERRHLWRDTFRQAAPELLGDLRLLLGCRGTHQASHNLQVVSRFSAHLGQFGQSPNAPWTLIHYAPIAAEKLQRLGEIKR